MAKERIDAESLLNQHSITDIIGKHVSLTKRGSEHYGTCPFHNDTKASLQVNERKNIYRCFPCGAGGDAIDFLMRLGYTFHDACKEIAGEDVFATGTKKTNAVTKPKPLSWNHIVPAPLPATDISHYRHGRPSRVWPYKTADGSIAGYVCRFDTPEGKEVLPYVYATNGKQSEWRWMGFAKPRPLFNLDQIAARPDASVIVVEGEKTAEAAQALIPTAVVTTWIGGSNAIHSTDWTPLHGRKVILWADNDWSHAYGEKHAKAGQTKPFHEQPGNAAMLQIAGIIKDHCPVLRWVKNDTSLPCGWDIADEPEWTPKQAKFYVTSNLIDVPFPSPEQPEEEPSGAEGIITFAPEIPEGYQNPEPPEYIQDDSGDEIGASEHFKFLGWNKEEGSQRFYFYQLESNTTLSYSASSFSKSSLITLAPLKFWETYFPGAKTNINLDSVQEYLIRTSIRKGPFNERLIRGRGAWVDRERVIIHRGTSLIVDGKRTDLGVIESKFIYETSDDLGIGVGNPLNKKEANALMDITRLMNWEREINAYLLAGWCVIAPFSGALKWRPHIWLTGSAGTGKSWVFKNVVRRLLGETALAVQGETSEAGLRQTLGHDALPVVFDEADIDDRRSADRIQNILTLMRSASTDDGGLLLKGSATGHAKSFSIRSCFAFASIGVQASQQSDRSRITLLSMKALPKDSPVRAKRWEELQRVYNEKVTDDFVERLQARTVSLLPTILKNAHTFSNAAAAFLGEQRTGDQLGALLAGAYSLFSDAEISFDDAKKWVSDKDWSEERNLSGTRDEISLLAHIMDHLVTVEGFDGKKFERTIGELVTIASGFTTGIGVTLADAEDKLNRIGIKTKVNPSMNDEVYIYISNSAKAVQAILKDSAWSKNHHKILLRLPRAVEKDSMRFGSGVVTRAVGIPLSVLTSDDW